ncbi:MAG: discoidin domain-containing protein [Deltaproteobacteria bacterium]|nr:discoidin domain-containing protein [Deltaproteobacteria bacterium]
MKRILLVLLAVGLVLLLAIPILGCTAQSETNPFPPPERTPPGPERSEETEWPTAPAGPEGPEGPGDDGPPISAYALNTKVEPAGAGSVSPRRGMYEIDTQVKISATAATGYNFDFWDGDASGSVDTITITMDLDKNVVAHFTAIVPPTPTTEWLIPISAVASGYDVWGDTWYTGPPSLSIDDDEITAWTLNDMGEITFDLGSEKLISGIEAYWGGHVTNGNTVNVYVGNLQVLGNKQFGATSNIMYFGPVYGRYVKYQTVAFPHNEYLQIADWSEIAEFKVLVEIE